MNEFCDLMQLLPDRLPVLRSLPLALLLATPFAGLLLLPRTPANPTASDSPRATWSVLHLLPENCPAATRLLTQLSSRTALEHAGQTIVLIGPSARIQASQLPAGIDPTSGPTLVLISPDGRVAYLGGYGDRPGQDLILLQQARAGLTPRPRPVSGCSGPSSGSAILAAALSTAELLHVAPSARL